MRFASLTVVLGFLTMVPGVAAAEDAAAVTGSVAEERGHRPASGDQAPGIGLETNVMWPFFPGGISELRLLVPVVRAERRDFRGELVLGTYSDFASRFIRDEDAGKVSNLSAKIGWRQFFVSGLHLELSANVGWRHETARPMDDVTIDALQARLWLLAGYQHELSPTLYANLRGGAGFHLYRSDDYASEEKAFAPGGDVNLGVRF